MTTTDELVLFAAKKVGVEVHKIEFKWTHQSEATVQWFEVDEDEVLPEYSFDLYSWTLLGKGMAVCKHPITLDRLWRWKVQVGEIVIHEKEQENVPLAFWQAWYDLEHQG